MTMDISLPIELIAPYKKPKRKTITKEQRQIIKNKCDGKCAYCGVDLDNKFHIDHAYAYYRGGKCEMDNYLPSCAKCNNYKLTYSIEEFRILISRQLELAKRNSVNYRTALRFGLIEEKDTNVVFYFEKREK